MTLEGQALEYRRLRAPAADRSILIDPPLDQVGELLAANRQLRAGYGYELHGRSLRDLGDDARRELLQAARDYTSLYREVPSYDASGPILLAGHQPELFHPGVWCKNFALGALARRHAGVAVNLVVDSDTIKRASLRVPGGSVREPKATDVRFDQGGPEIPYEERLVLDRSTFESFGRRVASQLQPLVPNPLIRAFWPRVLARAEKTSNLGACFAQARHELEGAWGLETLEAPQSRVCALPSFLWFMAHLLCELPRLHAIYNRAVGEYRQVNHIRSQNHPVPDLASDDQWLEAPFWVWRVGSPRRKRLFARRHGEALELTDRDGWQIDLPVCAKDLGRAVESLARLPATGVKIRSRALITTLFARLVLGDLFVHGIGGAKYDELTDLMVGRFFGLAPPRYLVLSGTLLLPIERDSVSEEQVRAVRQRLRQLIYHPEKHVDWSDVPPARRADIEALIAEKQKWIATPQTRDNAKRRCQAIRRVNEALQPWLNPQRQRLEQQRQRLADTLRAEQLLASREYAFCLYPEETLRSFLASVAGNA